MKKNFLMIPCPNSFRLYIANLFHQKKVNLFCKDVIRNSKDFKIFYKSLDEFEMELFHAALINLHDKKNKLHINNFAYTIRELIIIYLNRKAPIKSVESSPWYNQEKVRRSHQVKYIIQKNINDDYFDYGTSQILTKIDECAKNFNKVFDKLNKLTHINKKTLKYNTDDGHNYIKDLFESMFKFFTMSRNIENELQIFLGNYIEDHLYDEITNHTIDAIDECSTHHLIEDTYIHDIVVNDIDEEYIYFTGQGEISVEQQYGSSSDLKRGNGMTMSTSFPVSFSGKVATSDFSLVEIDPYFEVNNDDHYGIIRDKKYKRKKFLEMLFWKIYNFINDFPYKVKRSFMRKKINSDDLDF
jgi:hypothetical protein